MQASFCFGINPSIATPQKLDPTARRIQKIASEHGYDSWIILNLCSQRSTNPDGMDERQNPSLHQENLKIIEQLLQKYCYCSDVLFAYGDLINKRSYLNKNLCDIISMIKATHYGGMCYCLGKTKSGNARHPLYQKTGKPFDMYSLDGHTYSDFLVLGDNKCVVREYSESGELLFETWGTCKS